MVSRRQFLVRTAAAGLAMTALPAPGPVRAAASADGEFVTVEGIPIHFRRMGRGRPITLVHGASGNLNDMTFRLAPALARNHEVFAFDRPGHGLSGTPGTGGTSLRVQAALMRRALAQIGVERTLLVGHSYGGSVALAWALDAPGSVEGLALLAAPSQVWPGGLGWTTDLLANPLTGPVLASAAPHLVTRGFADQALTAVFAPQPVPPDYLAHLDLGLVLRSLRENARQLSTLKDEIRPMVPRYPALPMPVEILHGDADQTVPIEIHSIPLSGQIPRARLTPLPGIGHMIHQVVPDTVTAAVARLGVRAPR